MKISQIDTLIKKNSFRFAFVPFGFPHFFRFSEEERSRKDYQI